MHEAAAAKGVAGEIIARKMHRAKIKIGKMYGNSERFLQLVREFLSGTPFEKAELEAEAVDVVAKCPCGLEGKIDVEEHMHFVRCPACGRAAEVIQGNGIEILGGLEKSRARCSERASALHWKD